MNLSHFDEPLGEFELKPWHLAAGVIALGGLGALAYFLFIKKQAGVFAAGPGAPAPMAPSAAAATQCVKLGIQSEPIFDETDELVVAMRQAKAHGKTVYKVSTGRTSVLGSRNRFQEVAIWACPKGVKPPAETMQGDDDDEEELSLLERTRRRIR
jgi:hypothetical protein